MRAEEFVNEKVAASTAETGFKHSELANNGAWTLSAEGDTRQYGTHTANVIHIKVTDTKTNDELAWVDFLVKTRKADGEQYLESVYTHVNPQYRGQGLAKLMYQYANSMGNDIQPSDLQTDLGKGMWKGLNRSVRQLPTLPAEPNTASKVKPSVWQRIKQKMVPA